MLLTKTTELAIQSLLCIAACTKQDRVTPGQIAAELDESASYMSKVLQTLAKAGMLRSHRGKAGGFSLARTPEEITLLEVVEACQGVIAGNYCEGHKRPDENTCGYHQAMLELQTGVKNILGHWTLASILATPPPPRRLAPHCKLRYVLDHART